MPDEQTPQSDPVDVPEEATPAGGTDVNVSEGTQQGAKSIHEQIGEVLGREFASEEEALKTVKELNSLVGAQSVADGRKAASLVEKMTTQLAAEWKVSPEQARNYLTSLVDGTQQGQEPSAQQMTQNPALYSDPVLVNQVADLRSREFKRELLAAYPEAEANLKAIEEDSAITGSSFKELYERKYLPFVKLGREKAYQKRDEKLQGKVTTSTRETAPSAEDEELFEQASRTGKGWGAVIAKRIGLK